MNAFRVLAAVRSRSLQGVFRRAEAKLPRVSVTVALEKASAEEMIQAAPFDLAIVDLSLPWGLEFVLRIRRSSPGTLLSIITDPELREHDRAAMKAGVVGFLVQPVRLEHLMFQVEHAREVWNLREEALRLRADSERMEAHGIVAVGSEMRRVHHLLLRAAATSAPVALYGESGTGKELVARAVHSESTRRTGPFIAVNPSSIPESLLESELFGYVGGAFTGAVSERVGYVEAADGGTLFLDEIGDLRMTMQGKLLRLLQDRVIRRVGSPRDITVDFRLITATNKDLMAEVRAGRFREDLFYRIHVFPIYLPPLRTRREDIPVLVETLLRRVCEGMGRPVPGLAPGVLDLLSRHSWPGNVRELENAIHRVVAMKLPGETIEVADFAGLVQDVRTAPPPGIGPGVSVKPLDEHVTEYVAWAFEQSGRNKAKTARMLEIDRTTLYRRLRSAQTDRPG